MNCRLNAVQDSGIEEGVSLPELLTKRDPVEVIGFVDGLGRKYRQCGDLYIRVRSFGDTKLGFAPWVPSVIDVTPLATDDEVETLIEDGVNAPLLIAGPESASKEGSGSLMQEVAGLPPSQPPTIPELLQVLFSGPDIGLHGD